MHSIIRTKSYTYCSSVGKHLMYMYVFDKNYGKWTASVKNPNIIITFFYFQGLFLQSTVFACYAKKH